MSIGTSSFVEAIDRRVSCRAFEDTPLSADQIDMLRAAARESSADSGLLFELHVPHEDGSSLALSNKVFAGHPGAYVTCVGPNDPISLEKIGYFGQIVVLIATSLGLGSCWVAGTFDREKTTCAVPDGMMLHDVIPIGAPMHQTPFRQRSIRRAIRSKSKRPSKLYAGPTTLEEAPQWIWEGVHAIWKGPSAANRQPVVLAQDTYGAPVRAMLPRRRHDVEYTDLGIAKLQFKVAATASGAHGTWDWGVDGAYNLD